MALTGGQWKNGMLPHMIFAHARRYWWSRWLWGSNRCPEAPSSVATSGITQPPMVAIAALKVSAHLPPSEARDFLDQIYPKLLAYHQWLYRERDPEGDALVALIHHWETGLDNTPDWMELVAELPDPWWLKLLKATGGFKVIKLLRKDTQHIAEEQRMPTEQAIKSTLLALHYRHQRYNSQTILTEKRLAVESLFFNSILIKANRCLEDIANLTGAKVPTDLRQSFRAAEQALEDLYDSQSHAYQARNVATKTAMRTVSISSLMPLFAGCISEERAAGIVKMLTAETKFWPRWPVPSVPVHSPYFSEKRYWQGPTWVNTNWFVIEGLKQYGFDELADELRAKTLKMVADNGFYEYFSPLHGTGYGTAGFSWTAALFIDLKKSPQSDQTKTT